MDNIIEIKNLKKSFGSVKAVNDLSFTVKEGELFAFLMFVLELLKFFWRILCSVIGFMSKKRSNRHSAK